MEKTFQKSAHFLEQFFPFLGPLEGFFGGNLFKRKIHDFYLQQLCFFIIF